MSQALEPGRGPVSLVRVAAVTGLLVLFGAVAGSVVAFLILSGMALVLSDMSLFGLSVIGIAASIGAASGAVLGPAIAWLFLRTIPLGKAILHTSVGAAIGAALALAIPRGAFLFVLGAATAGALLAALRLRLAARKARS
jgi:hypothetical protein